MPQASLHDRAVVRITGPDSGAVLHNVLTLDLPDVDRHGSGYGALLTPQGKILWDFVLHRHPDGYAADLRADQAEAFAGRSDDRRPGGISEQHRGGAVVLVDDPAEGFGADYQGIAD